MALQTRRYFLHAAVAVAGGLAGCSRLVTDTAQSSQTTPADAEQSSSENNASADPPTVLLRADSERPPIRLTNPEQETAESSYSERPSPRITNVLIDSQSRSQRLTVANRVDDEGVASFVAETNFDRETLYLNTNQVEDCFRLRLCQVSWRSDKVQADYAREIRSYDERCAAENTVFESRLIRIPAALDEESVNSFGSTIRGGGRCGTGGAAIAEGGSESSESVGTVHRATDGGA